MTEGDYVRTKYGIEKITDIKEWVNFQGYEKIITTDKNQYETLYEQSEIIKSSPNIIDLIEVGDYVNGYLVIEKDINNELRYIDLKDRNMKYVKYLDIKSIVTKEMFSSVEYRVEND